MSKPWSKLEIDYMDHPKFSVLSASAICLWHAAKNYCDKWHTDGLISLREMKHFRFYAPKFLAELMHSAGQKADGTAYAPLLEAHAAGFQMHDYLDHNDCREVVLDRFDHADFEHGREEFLQRLGHDRGLLDLIRQRDGDACRFCGHEVYWRDRRGAGGGTYSLVNESGPDDLENIVVACRGCAGRRETSDTPPRSAPINPEPTRNLAGITSDPGKLSGLPSVPVPDPEKKIRTEGKNICAETDAVSPPTLPPVLEFPTDGERVLWVLTEAQVASWAQLYPNTDVLGECRKAKAWVEASPQRRKTASGMARFLVNWLNQTTNRGGGTAVKPAGRWDNWTPPTRKLDPQ